MRARAAAALLCALAACAPRVREAEPTRVDTVVVGETSVRLEYRPRDGSDARRVASALEKAIPAAERWGRLRVPVTVVLRESHEALEAAVQRPGYGWLRAWARFDTIDLQAPRTWSFLFGPSDRELEELVTHELTHCVMYQQAGSAWSWPYLEIPLWFREGMASVTAGQGYRRGPPSALRAFWARPLPGAGDGAGGGGKARPAGDPIADPEPLYRSESDLVYAAAHLAFEFLQRRYGTERIRAVLAQMSEGHPFPAAFRRAIGISAPEFEADFRRSVALGAER